MDTQEYLNSRVEEQISWYDGKSRKAQKSYKIFQVIEICLAASIPLLSGYTTTKYIPLVIGVFGAVIAIIEAVVKLNKYHENWIQYRTTCEMLRHEKHLFITNTYPYSTKEQTIDNAFIQRIESIISSENNQWKTINTKIKDENDGTS